MERVAQRFLTATTLGHNCKSNVLNASSEKRSKCITLESKAEFIVYAAVGYLRCRSKRGFCIVVITAYA